MRYSQMFFFAHRLRTPNFYLLTLRPMEIIIRTTREPPASSFLHILRFRRYGLMSSRCYPDPEAGHFFETGRSQSAARARLESSPFAQQDQLVECILRSFRLLQRAPG